MYNQFLLRIAGWFLAWTTHRTMRPTEIEDQILSEFMERSKFYTPTTSKPVIFIWRNLQGPEKTIKPQQTSTDDKATVLSFNEVRNILRETGEDPNRTQFLTELIAIAIGQDGRSVVIDEGFDSFRALASILRRARVAHIRLTILAT